MAGTLQITVNGRRHDVAAAPETPLLYVLRNELELNGPQFGCGLEQCGACLVHLDGKAVPSCVLPVAAVAGARITTLEGLGTAEAPHPVQRAFIAEQAAQCGFCLNGMIMATAALLAEHPRPSDEQIRATLERNLCRCGAHLRVLRAVRRAAAMLS